MLWQQPVRVWLNTCDILAPLKKHHWNAVICFGFSSESQRTSYCRWSVLFSCFLFTAKRVKLGLHKSWSANRHCMCVPMANTYGKQLGGFHGKTLAFNELCCRHGLVSSGRPKFTTRRALRSKRTIKKNIIIINTAFTATTRAIIIIIQCTQEMQDTTATKVELWTLQNINRDNYKRKKIILLWLLYWEFFVFNKQKLKIKKHSDWDKIWNETTFIWIFWNCNHLWIVQTGQKKGCFFLSMTLSKN